MSKNVIFCWSGTGNCLTMAKIIAGELGDTDIIMARKKPARLDVTDAERVGFVFPCHGGGAPVDFLEYMKDVKISPNAYTFAVSQSASYAGIGLHKLSKIHRLDYWKAVHHQCTCIWLFPHWIMIPPMPASLATKLADKKAVSIAKDILSGARTEKKPPKNPLNVIENAGWSTVTKSPAASRSATSASAAASAWSCAPVRTSSWKTARLSSEETASSVWDACSSARRKPSLSRS